MKIPDWEYEGKVLNTIPTGIEAFVYLITFEDGSLYIGKKNTTSTRRKKVKGKIRRKVVVTESNWKVYVSSSKVVKEKLAQGHKLKARTIIHMCETKGMATYLEVLELFVNDVLCNDTYLNLNILARFFKCYKYKRKVH